jgi:hypothetical protein
LSGGRRDDGVTRGPLAAFEDASVDAVAAEWPDAVDGTRLRRLVADHQQSVRDLPGVENIVYEWRRGFPVNPVVLRTDSAYFLLVAPWVWAEFVSALSLSDAEADALRAVHERQFRRSVAVERDRIDPAAAADHLETDADGTLRLGDWEPLVLTRP